MPPRIELVREWMVAARQDLQAADVLLASSPSLPESACFHLQQAVEKALKGVLLLNDQRPPRTHDLIDLMGLCERWLPGLNHVAGPWEWLTTCAVDLRYPDSASRVASEMVADALAATHRMFEFIIGGLPAEVQP